MSNNNIICRINDTPSIRVKIFDEPTIICKFGDQGLKGDKGATGATGPAGTTNHNALINLDYDNSGHIDFSKKLIQNVTYYVDSDLGNDSNSGTELLPFKTIQKSIDILSNNLDKYDVTIYLKDGTYTITEAISLKGFSGGGSYRGIQIKSFSGNPDNVLIIGNCDSLIEIYNCSGIWIDKISLRILNSGVCIFINESHVIVHTCKFGDNGNTATYGVFSSASVVGVYDCLDIDSNKVEFALGADSGGIIGYREEFGDNLDDGNDAGLVTNAITLNKLDYDDAVSKKHDGTLQQNKLIYVPEYGAFLVE